MCGTQVPKIISRNSPPDAWAAFLFSGSWCIWNEKRRSPVSKTSGTVSYFIALIPQQIDPSWHPEWGAKLAAFPLNLVYAKRWAGNARSDLETVVYWLDPGTYREDSHHREMCYFTKRQNGCRVRVIYDKNPQTEKFHGDSVICSATGPCGKERFTNVKTAR
jgi:hypothetical protein